MNLQGEPSGEKFTLSFGRRIGLTLFVLIATAVGCLMTTGSQGLAWPVSDPGGSSAGRCIRSPVPLPAFNEVSHPRMDIACSGAACESEWITAHS